MTTLAPDTLILPAPADSAVSSTSTGIRLIAKKAYRPKARSTFQPVLPKTGRHLASVAGPIALVALLGALLSGAALVMGLGR